MVSRRSLDDGRTWKAPEAVAPRARLLRMAPNVAASGKQAGHRAAVGTAGRLPAQHLRHAPALGPRRGVGADACTRPRHLHRAPGARARSTPSPTWPACAWATRRSSRVRPGHCGSGRVPCAPASPSSCRMTAIRSPKPSTPAPTASTATASSPASSGSARRDCSQGPSASPTRTRSAWCVTPSWRRPSRSSATPGSAWALPVVGETWDGWLNDIDGQHVRAEHLDAALDGARGGAGGRGQRGRRHGHDLPSLQGRHRDGLASAGRCRRRLHRRGAGAGQLRSARAARHRRRAGRSRDRPRRGALRPRGRSRRRRAMPTRVRSSSSLPPTRRCCRTSASAWRSGPGWAWRAPAARGSTRAAISSSPSPPATAGWWPRTPAWRRPFAREVRTLDDAWISALFWAAIEADRGGHRQCPGGRRDDGGPGWARRPSPAARPARRGLAAPPELSRPRVLMGAPGAG